MIWICKLCGKKDQVHRCTDGTLFVLHHCAGFSGSLIPDQGSNAHRYVASLDQFFQNYDDGGRPINITVFPLREAHHG